jgi:hypothetical protein
MRRSGLKSNGVQENEVGDIAADSGREQWHVVACQPAIPADHRQAFDAGPGYQRAVERVFVDRRQLADGGLPGGTGTA